MKHRGQVMKGKGGKEDKKETAERGGVGGRQSLVKDS